MPDGDHQHEQLRSAPPLGCICELAISLSLSQQARCAIRTNSFFNSMGTTSGLLVHGDQLHDSLTDKYFPFKLLFREGGIKILQCSSGLKMRDKHPPDRIKDCRCLDKLSSIQDKSCAGNSCFMMRLINSCAPSFTDPPRKAFASRRISSPFPFGAITS